MIKGFKQGSSLVFTNNRGDKARYDLANGNCFFQRYGAEERQVRDIKSFFRGMNQREVISSFEDVRYQNFLNHIAKAENRCTNVGTFLERLQFYTPLENYYLLGINIDSIKAYERGYYCNDTYKYKYRKEMVRKKPTSIYSRDALKFMAECSVMFTQSWETRYEEHTELFNKIIRYLRERYIGDIEIYDIFASYLSGMWGRDPFHELINNYGYEYKALIDQLVYYIRGEGLNLSEAMRLLRDYANMQKEMVRLRTILPDLTEVISYGRYDKYPKYLKSIHDIVQKNYRAFADKYDAELFEASVDKKLQYSYGYKVIAPKSPEDIKKEGVDLHHCVASYIKRIIQGSTQIMFLRLVDDESLVTLEINHGRLVQAKGMNNRNVNEKEQEFLERYCRVKKLQYLV